jgi:carbamoyl-phosphate synthase large subunit
MNIKNILITAANGDLAEAVFGVLKDSYPNINIYGCEVGDLWPAKAILDNVVNVPRGDDKDYINDIKKIVSQLSIDLVIPCSDIELVRFAAAKNNNECEFNLLMLSPDLIHIFSDKYLSAKWLEKYNIATPKTTLLTDASSNELPLVVKPRNGSGSVGIYKVTTPELLEGLKVEFGDSYVAQEYLDIDNQEYTCAIFKCNDLTKTLILHRRLDAGRTVSATAVQDPKIENELLKLTSVLSNLNGLLNVQLRLTDKGPKIFEINPRVSSTVKMRHMLGFTDLVWAIDCMNTKLSPKFKGRIEGTVYRLSREIIKP